MSRRVTALDPYQRELLSVFVISFVGLFFLGNLDLANRGLDALFRARQALPGLRAERPSAVAIVYLDVNTVRDPGEYGDLVERLRGLEVRSVTFDLVFTNAFWTQASDGVARFDAAVRRAVSENAIKFVFATQAIRGVDGALADEKLAEPIQQLVDTLPGQVAIGSAALRTNRLDGMIRSCSSLGYVHPPLALALEPLVLAHPNPRPLVWRVNYYGAPGSIETVDRHEWGDASADLRSRLAGRHVLVAHRPSRSGPMELAWDRWPTPFARSVPDFGTGAEIHATLMANVLNDDWIRTKPWSGEAVMILFVGVMAGVVFVRLNPLQGLLLALTGAVLALVVGLWWFGVLHCYLPWAVVAGPQMAAAWLMCFLPVKRAFLSYRRADGEHVAFLLHEALQRRGVETFVDVASEEAGELRALLLTQVSRRSNLILVLTPGVITGWNPAQDWIGEEVKRAQAEGNLILPVDVGETGRFIKEEYVAKGRALPEPLAAVLGDHLLEIYDGRDPHASVERIARRLRRCIRWR